MVRIYVQEGYITTVSLVSFCILLWRSNYLEHMWVISQSLLSPKRFRWLGHTLRLPLSIILPTLLLQGCLASMSPPDLLGLQCFLLHFCALDNAAVPKEEKRREWVCMHVCRKAVIFFPSNPITSNLYLMKG